MTQIQEINWNNFKTKFNGTEQLAFQNLCYELFCDEFSQDNGIFSYKNQTGIETDPITIKNEVIGFQAKFLETKISDNKKKLKKSIEDAKRKNPNLNKILFYINQKFSESSKKDEKEPKYKIEIEEYAKSKGVKIVWKVQSQIDKQLTKPENQTLAQYYFRLGKTVRDFICELKQHTQAILGPIHSKIEFNGNEIKIDRSIVRKNLISTLKNSSFVILSGESGVGKTAIIKDFYSDIAENTPFFIFKATEFNIPNINDLFQKHGNFSLLDFVNEFKGENTKYIVIDSAEKLSDIENRDIFQEFLSVLLKNEWKVIFTTRYNYLDDLKFQFVEIYHLNFQPLNIENIEFKELKRFSEEYNFILPKDERFLELLQNPFYLNEYLQNYKEIGKETVDLSTFESLLWNKKILNSSYQQNNIHIKRENCFLEIAKKRADSGHFFITVNNYNDEILRNLENDEIIKLDLNAGGYFITHDIYEEWALKKIIERSFNKSVDYKKFYELIGSSLPIRRAFRNWLSEKLLNNQVEVKSLIEESIVNVEIESYWKDEILISILLSDYSEIFFQLFEAELLKDNQKLLLKIVFLLLIACKEIDESFLELLGIDKKDKFISKTIYTIPKGNGWDCTIDFIHEHKGEIGFQNMNIILSLLDDWNNKNKEGETTKKAGQIGLHHYEEIYKNGGFGYSSHDDRKEKIIRVILNSSHEIKDELNSIFNDIIFKKETSHRDKYYEIVKTILSSATNSFEVVKNLPEQVIKLANLFWFQIPNQTDWHSRIGVEEDFCIVDNSDFNYSPASAFQTPIFQLLHLIPNTTIDFILQFTNKTVECYAKSELKNELQEVDIFVDETKIIKQYISNRLWNMYRGTQVSTYLLESIHMALEKWLLEYAKTASQKNLENLCKYLIENSKSTSITAIVTNIVLAYPQKLFNIAKILFQTKEFFIHDTRRMMFDSGHKKQLLFLKNNFPTNYKNEIYENERIKACDDEHRKLSLEHIAFNYQFLKSKDNNDFEKQREALWKIFDNYYNKLPPESEQSENDKTWRLYLARMDIRKMTMTTKPEKDEKRLIITFNSKIDSQLKKFSKNSLKKGSDAVKYFPLKMWSECRFTREESKYKQYEKYEKNPQLVISESKEIIEDLKNGDKVDFSLLPRSIPAYTCSVLIRDFFKKLNKKEKEFCKEIIIEFASLPLQVTQYSFQISDGTEPTIVSLPQIIQYFPEDRNKIKSLLFLILLNPRIEILTFAVRAVLHTLWEINFDDAQSIFLGYLFLKPKYDDLRDEIRKKNYKYNTYELSEEEVVKIFIKRYEKELEKVILDKITYKDISNLEELNLE